MNLPPELRLDDDPDSIRELADRIGGHLILGRDGRVVGIWLPVDEGPDLVDVLARLYRSEINVSISTFWDMGWEVKLGDELNGYRVETTIDCPTDDPTVHRSVETVARGIAEVAAWLDEQARIHWPDSEYARS